MADYVVDKGLLRLRAQIDAAAPGRSKKSDGFIGDTAHQGTVSDHNPETISGNPPRQVDAADITHDPARGADMHRVAEALRASRDARISYVIWTRRIFYGRGGPLPWLWHSYTGKNPHASHLHISVRDDTHDQDHPWSIGIGGTMALTPAQPEIDAWRLDALAFGATTVRSGPLKGEPMWIVAELKETRAIVNSLATRPLVDFPEDHLAQLAAAVADRVIERLQRLRIADE